MEGAVKAVKFIFWILVAVSVMLFWQVVRSNPSDARTPEINYSTFISQAESGQIERVTITGSRIEGEYRNAKGRFWLTGPSNPTVFLGVLHDKGVEIQFRNGAQGSVLLQLLGTWAPLILLVATWFYMSRRVQRRTNSQSPAGGGLDASGGPS
jgi:cell division protease FtsH